MSIIITSCSSAICGVLSVNSQVQEKIQADKERTPTHCSIIDLRLGLFMLRCVSICVSVSAKSVEHVLWECSEYSSIFKEFISNLDGILQNDFHLKLSFDKAKHIFDQSIWECSGQFNHWFSKIKVFLCSICMGFEQRETLSFRFIFRLNFTQLHQTMHGKWQKCYAMVAHS